MSSQITHFLDDLHLGWRAGTYLNCFTCRLEWEVYSPIRPTKCFCKILCVALPPILLEVNQWTARTRPQIAYSWLLLASTSNQLTIFPPTDDSYSLSLYLPIYLRSHSLPRLLVRWNSMYLRSSLYTVHRWWMWWHPIELLNLGISTVSETEMAWNPG